MKCWLTGTTLLIGALAAPPATADPGQVPDLSGYTPVNAKDYSNYYYYPTTTGAQFVTPGGYRCRITYTGRANPPFKMALCWGALPGTPHNFVSVVAGMNTDPAQFQDGDPAKQETYSAPPDSSSPSVPHTINPDAYKPLPAGSKLTYSDSGTCAVTDVRTTCVLGAHGFVLDPNGSWTF